MSLHTTIAPTSTFASLFAASSSLDSSYSLGAMKSSSVIVAAAASTTAAASTMFGDQKHWNASEFFRSFPPGAMYATTCSEAVLNFQPSCAQFIRILGPAGVVLVVGASLGLLLLVGLFIDSFLTVQRCCPSEQKFPVSIVLSVYPVLGLCSFLGILFPKANTAMDAASQLWFSLCMWQFFKLTLTYFGGETAFVAHMQGKVLPWRGPPCCCWPCCWPLCPKNPVTKKQVQMLRILVMQHPFVQCIMSIIGITMWVEGHYTIGYFGPTNAYVYVFSITTVSFMFGLWAFIVGFKASIPELRSFHYGMKILTFQLCLVFLRFQAFVFNLILLPSGAIPCLPPLSPAVFANAILCSLLLGQLVMLSVIARYVYKLETPMVVKDSAKNFNNQAKLLLNGPASEVQVNITPQGHSASNAQQNAQQKCLLTSQVHTDTRHTVELP